MGWYQKSEINQERSGRVKGNPGKFSLSPGKPFALDGNISSFYRGVSRSDGFRKEGFLYYMVADNRKKMLK